MNSLLSFLNPYLWGAAAILAGLSFAFGYHKGESAEHAANVAIELARVQAEKVATISRLADIAKLEGDRAEINANILKVKDDELAKVRADLIASRGMRKPAFCSEPARETAPQSASSSAATPPLGWLLPASVERNIQALILETEEAVATGRACQAFIKSNGLVP